MTGNRRQALPEAQPGGACERQAGPRMEQPGRPGAEPGCARLAIGGMERRVAAVRAQALVDQSRL